MEMNKVFQLLLTMLVGLLLIVLFVRWYASFCYRRIVANKSDVLEAVLLTGEVPLSWRKRTLEKLASYSAGGFAGDYMQKWLMHIYARRISGLVSFVRGNQRLTAEEKRDIVGQLQEIARQWRSSQGLHA